MAEFVQKKLEDMRPIFEMMKKLELFTEHEIRGIVKKIKEHEYKLQRHTKSKEDFLRYIQYNMDLLKLVKQRREKYNISQKKSDIDFSIADKINRLYKEAIFKFQDDLRFWTSYMNFCKHVKFNHCVSRMMPRMLAVHQNKPKCWHIAAQWEIEENKDLQNASNLLLRGLHFHPDSQLIYRDVFKLELEVAVGKNENSELKGESNVSMNIDKSEIPNNLKKCFVIYEQAFNKIKDINFVIELLNIIQEYEHTEKLQERILSDMVKEYSQEPLMWDTMARRELEGLIQPITGNDETSMEIDTSKQTSLRDRISNCYEVYQTAVATVNTEDMWSLFIDCMLEINQDSDTLPNYKRKLLKNALIQGSQAKKLREKYYLNWISMINEDQSNQDPTQSKLYEVLCEATEALPESESLWHARLNYLHINSQEDLADEVFNKAVDHLGENSLRLWKTRLLYLKSKFVNLESFFQKALKSPPAISKFMKPFYIEWAFFEKDIDAARKLYEELCLHPPMCLELHKKMISIELSEPQNSLKNARRPHEMAILQFGKKNTDVWIDFITFEVQHGDPMKISSIYDRAIKTLYPKLADNFIAEYNSIKSDIDKKK